MNPEDQCADGCVSGVYDQELELRGLIRMESQLLVSLHKLEDLAVGSPAAKTVDQSIGECHLRLAALYRQLYPRQDKLGEITVDVRANVEPLKAELRDLADRLHSALA